MRAKAYDATLSSEQSSVADAGIKAMIPMGRPFLDYSLSAFADAGVRDVCLVVGPEHGAIRDYYTSVEAARLRIAFTIQDRPLGTADAVLAARTFAGNDPFLVANSDNYYPAPVIAELCRESVPALPAFSRAGLIRDGQISADRIAKYALLDIDSEGILRRIVEKPTDDEAAALGHAAVSMNCWLFDERIFEACRRVPVSKRGEHELPLAVQFAIDHLDMRFRAFHADAPVLDLSQRDDIASVAARLRGTRVEL